MYTNSTPASHQPSEADPQSLAAACGYFHLRKKKQRMRRVSNHHNQLISGGFAYIVSHFVMWVTHLFLHLYIDVSCIKLKSTRTEAPSGGFARQSEFFFLRLLSFDLFSHTHTTFRNICIRTTREIDLHRKWVSPSHYTHLTAQSSLSLILTSIQCEVMICNSESRTQFSQKKVKLFEFWFFF